MKLPKLKQKQAKVIEVQGNKIEFQPLTIDNISQLEDMVGSEENLKSKTDKVVFMLALSLSGYDENTFEEKVAFIKQLDFGHIDELNELIADIEQSTKKK